MCVYKNNPLNIATDIPKYENQCANFLLTNVCITVQKMEKGVHHFHRLLAKFINE